MPQTLRKVNWISATLCDVSSCRSKTFYLRLAIYSLFIQIRQYSPWRLGVQAILPNVIHVLRFMERDCVIVSSQQKLNLSHKSFKICHHILSASNIRHHRNVILDLVLKITAFCSPIRKSVFVFFFNITQESSLG